MNAVRLLSLVITITLVTIRPDTLFAQSQLVAESGFVEEVVLSDLPPATAVAFGPGDRIFLALKDGIVRVAKNGALLSTPFIDISAMTNRRTDRGLGGIALDPQFPTRPYVYLYYTYDPPELTPDDTTPRVSRLIRVQADAAKDYNVALADTTEILVGKNSTAQNTARTFAVGTTIIPEPASCMTGLTMDGTPIEDCIPSDELSHSAGTLIFGTDGYLYASHGDASSYSGATKTSLRSQLLDSLAGKVIRVNPNTGAGVADNPFYDPLKPNANRSKVWAYGFRNPFRMTLNPATGQVYLGDVGTSAWEEVNFGKGTNHGWPCYEGGNTTNDIVGTGNNLSLVNTAFKNMSRTSAFCATLYNLGLGAVAAPLFSYRHPVDANGDDLGASVTGVAFYAGATYPSEYRGALFIGDYAQRTIRYLTFDASGFPTVHPFANETSASAGPVQVITAPDTNIYALFLDLVTRKSQLRRYRYTGSNNTPPTVVLQASPTGGSVPLAVTFNTLGTVDADGQSLTYSWNFGDGTGSGESSPNPTHIYQSVGTFEVTVLVKETTAPFAESTSSITIRTGVTPPKVHIDAPTTDTTYAIGQTISFSGYAEFNGTRAPDSALTWSIIQEHNLHEHLVDEVPGVASGSFQTSEHSDNTRFIVCLYATAGQGLDDQACVTINPRTTDTSFLSEPTGALITYVDEELDVLAPYIAKPVQNSRQTIVAAATHQGRNFSRWSDGVTSRERSFTVGTTPLSFKAIYENVGPQAVITASKLTGTAPLQVTFSASNSSDPEGSGLQYLWNLGNGETATTVSASKTFNTPGSYPITLRVTDSLGLYSEVSETITVVAATATNKAPTVVAPLPQTTRAGNATQLNGTVTDDRLPNGTLQTTWSRVRGPATLQFASPNLASTNVNTPSVGTYLVKLEATDSLLRVAQNTLITANPSASQFSVTSFSLMNAATDQVIPGYEAIKNGSIINISSLGASSINIRANTQGSGIGSVVFLQDAASLATDNTAPHTIAPSTSSDLPAWSYTPKRYLITAVPYSSSGGTGTQGDALSIQFTLTSSNIVNTAPTARIQASPNAGSAPLTVTLNGSASTDPQNDPLTYLWEFADATTSTASITRKTFTVEGSYSVKLTVKDPAGLSQSTTVTLPVGAEPQQTPTITPTTIPTLGSTPTSVPTSIPTLTPTTAPTAVTTPTASKTPTPSPTPTTAPTTQPTLSPTTTPTPTPIVSGTNQAPSVDPGLAQTALFGSAITLRGTATDDGLPPGNLTILWSRVRGPGTLSFSQPAQATTSVTPSVPGTYLVKLEATDTLLRSANNGILTVNPTNTAFGVSSFTLINAATGQPFPGYESITNGAVITLSSLGSNPQINIRANTTGSGVASIQWLQDASAISTDSVAPFAIAPSSGATYPAWAYTAKLYRLTAVPFSGSGATGTQGAALSIQFTLR